MVVSAAAGVLRGMLLLISVVSSCSFSTPLVRSPVCVASSWQKNIPSSLCKFGGSSSPKRFPLRNLQCALKVEESKTKVRGYNAWYKVVSPSSSEAEQQPPVVILHGGPGVPHDYLCPLEQLAQDFNRPVFFYDQLGCGNSDEPQDEDFYSPRQCGEDCVTMLQHFAENHALTAKGGFHLFGQSWGGCLAVETVLEQYKGSPLLQENLKSVVLASTPSSPALAMDSARALIDKYLKEAKKKSPEELNMRDDWPREEQYIEQWRLQCANEKFQQKHNLRLNHDPDCLKLAYTKLGVVWRGAHEVADWKVTAAELRERWPAEVPVTMLRGQHDFVDKECVQAFREGLSGLRYKELGSLSHMAHLEDTHGFVAALEGALKAMEEQQPEPTAEA